MERCAKQMAGVLLRKHCHIVANSWITWEAAEVRAASNFGRCRRGSFGSEGAAERIRSGGQKFSFIILLDYSTISNMCFVCGCVFICVFCLGLWLGEGWMEGRRRGREFRGIGRLHVGRMLTDTAPHCQSTFLHSAPQLEC